MENSLENQIEKEAEKKRAMLSHEDTLRDGRVQWLLLSQTILVAAFTQIFDQPGIVKFSVSLFGLVTTLSFMTTLREGSAATAILKSEWEQFLKDKCIDSSTAPRIMGCQHDKDKQKIEELVKNNNLKKLLPHSLVPQHFLPRAYLIIWVILLIVSLIWGNFLP